jgi:hypothetical protein
MVDSKIPLLSHNSQLLERTWSALIKVTLIASVELISVKALFIPMRKIASVTR